MLTRVCSVSAQVFPGLILSDIKPAKRLRFRTVCYLLVQLMHCRKMFKAEIPFSNVLTCEDDDKVGRLQSWAAFASRGNLRLSLDVSQRGAPRVCGFTPRPRSSTPAWQPHVPGSQPAPPSVGSIPGCPLLGLLFGVPSPALAEPLC